MTWMPKIVEGPNGRKEIQNIETSPHRIYVKDGMVKMREAVAGRGEEPMNWEGWIHPSYNNDRKAALLRCIASLFDGKPLPSPKSPLDHKLEIIQLEAQKKALTLKIEHQKTQLEKSVAAEKKDGDFRF